MYFEFEYYGSTTTTTHEDEKSRYFRRSDALLSELQASYLSQDELEDDAPGEPTCSRGSVARPLIHQQHPNSSPPTPSTLMRPIPQRPSFMQEPTEWDNGHSSTKSEHSDFATEDSYYYAQWIEELRSEGARNPLREDYNVVLSESTQLFLNKNACLNSCACATNTPSTLMTTTPSLLSLLIKPVAVRATDVTHNNMM